MSKFTNQNISQYLGLLRSRSLCLIFINLGWTLIGYTLLCPTKDEWEINLIKSGHHGPKRRSF